MSGLFIFVGFDPTLFLACTQALFYFSFRSFTKHQRARERSERGARERKITLRYPLALAVNKFPLVYLRL